MAAPARPRSRHHRPDRAQAFGDGLTSEYHRAALQAQKGLFNGYRRVLALAIEGLRGLIQPRRAGITPQGGFLHRAVWVPVILSQ